MKIFLGSILVLILAAATASALHLKIADGPLATVFPENGLQRAALHRCEEQNSAFDRLDPAARAVCYQDTPAASTQPSLPPSTVQAPNQVDLRAAASRDGASGQATPPPPPVTPIRR